MKHYEVVAAVMHREKNGTQYFCAKRPIRYNEDGTETETSRKWEFPGGKIEEGEKAEDALVREIKEEMNTKICTEKFLCTVNYEYKNFSITMHAFLSSIIMSDSSALPEVTKLCEHLDSAWLYADELKSKDWAPADLPIVDAILKNL